MNISILSTSHRKSSQSKRISDIIHNNLLKIKSELDLFSLDFSYTVLPFWSAVKKTAQKDTGPESLMLAKNFDEKLHNPKGWIMSEKLDGVRCYWNGVAMYTRNGKIFYPPKWFKD